MIGEIEGLLERPGRNAAMEDLNALLDQSNRGRGVVFCEGNDRRGRFAIRFRAPQDRQPLREVPPDDDLLGEEQSHQPPRRLDPRGSLEQLFRR